MYTMHFHAYAPAGVRKGRRCTTEHTGRGYDWLLESAQKEKAEELGIVWQGD